MTRLTPWLLAASICGLLGGCPAPPTGTDTGTDGTGDGSGGGAAATPLNYKGSLSGAVNAISTTGSLAGNESAQRVPLSGGEVVWLTDLEGNRLLDANGEEYPDFPVNAGGTFDLPNLPVGVDIVLNFDLDGDGEADMYTIIHIPKDAGGDTGELDGAVVDPLSTLTGAKLLQMLVAHGVDPYALELSFAGLIGRIRDAYEHLLEDSGIDHQIDLDDIANMTDEELAALFAQLIPLAAQRAMNMAESNIALALADDVEGVVKAAAQTLLEGGFAIADDPGGIDLLFLGDLPNVETLTLDEFHGMSAGPMMDDVPSASASAFDAPDVHEPIIYINTLAEVDRNYIHAGDDDKAMMTKPLFGEFMLAEIAEVYLEGKTVSLADLHRLMVDVEIGLGVRLTYMKWGGPGHPPVNVFETPGGNGIEKDMMALFQQLEGLQPDEKFGDPMATRASPEVRRIVADFLEGTAEPSLERLFGGFLMERVPSAEEFAAHVRDQRAHLPFSCSGPSQWFVVADADSFQNADAEAITVNAEMDEDGDVTRVWHNPGGDGKFYLGHGPITNAGMETELIRRSNGRFLHNHRGEPQFLEMSDRSIFDDVGGRSFFEAFSESGQHWPGAPALRVPNYGFDPSLPPDPETNPPDWEAFVLVSEHGPNGVPVRVDYLEGVATYNEAGQYYLLFDERSDAEGLFALISETGELLEDTPGDWETRVLVAAQDVQGIDLMPETFTHVFGIEVPNRGYDSEGAPYYDDINNNGVQDAGEPTFAERQFLFDSSDWRSTWVEKYYRRADNNGFPRPEDIDWGSDTPKQLNGVALVPRNFRPRLNAFLFGRPNSALNLLLAFSPPEFFNGTQSIDRSTPINPLMAIALIDLVFEQVINVEAVVDWDGPGGMPPHTQLVDAWLFVAPLDDPLALIAEGFVELAE